MVAAQFRGCRHRVAVYLLDTGIRIVGWLACYSVEFSSTAHRCLGISACRAPRLDTEQSRRLWNWRFELFPISVAATVHHRPWMSFLDGAVVSVCRRSRVLLMH